MGHGARRAPHPLRFTCTVRGSRRKTRLDRCGCSRAYPIRQKTVFGVSHRRHDACDGAVRKALGHAQRPRRRAHVGQFQPSVVPRRRGAFARHRAPTLPATEACRRLRICMANDSFSTTFDKVSLSSPHFEPSSAPCEPRRWGAARTFAWRKKTARTLGAGLL